MRKKLPHHIPFGTEFTENVDYDLVFFMAEFVAVDAPIQLIFKAFLNLYWCYE